MNKNKHIHVYSVTKSGIEFEKNIDFFSLNGKVHFWQSINQSFQICLYGCFYKKKPSGENPGN